jgi:hypothetical protein
MDRWKESRKKRVFISANNNMAQGCVTLLKIESRTREKETFLSISLLFTNSISRIPYRRLLYCVPIV